MKVEKNVYPTVVAIRLSRIPHIICDGPIRARAWKGFPEPFLPGIDYARVISIHGVVALYLTLCGVRYDGDPVVVRNVNRCD